MKLLFNRISNRISGAENYNFYLLKGLKNFRRLQFTFSSDNKILNERLRRLNIRAVYINPHIDEVGTKRQFIRALISLPSYCLAYKNLFNSAGRQDLIIFESMTEKIFLTVPITLFGGKIVWIEHGPLFQTRRAKIVKILFWINSKFVKKIICVSKATQNDLIKNYIQKEKTAMVHIGIDTKLFSPLTSDEKNRIKLKLKLIDRNIIGYSGTITEEKGIKVLLEIASLYIKRKRNIIFLIVGNGNLLDWLRNEVARRRISSYFYFTNRVEDVRDYLGIMDVFLFPTLHQEGLSMSLLEANAMGIPVVTRDIGGNGEIINNYVNGVLYKNSSPSKIINIIEKVLIKRKIYSKEARSIVMKNFMLEKCSKQFYSLFEDLVYEN